MCVAQSDNEQRARLDFAVCMWQMNAIKRPSRFRIEIYYYYIFFHSSYKPFLFCILDLFGSLAKIFLIIIYFIADAQAQLDFLNLFIWQAYSFE